MSNIESLNLIKKNFHLNKDQLINFNKYIAELYTWNSHTNLVGKSTLSNPLKFHILDCLQISKYINNHNKSIIDMGSGAGLPGIILSIYNFVNVSLADSNIKKIKFIKHVSNELNLSLEIIHSRIENIKNKKFDYIVSRALANLDKLLFYSLKLSHKETKMIFLKGKQFKDEIEFAKKNWKFNFSIEKSLSDSRGRIILLSNLKPNV